MKGIQGWSFRPYSPLMTGENEIYICRVVPGRDFVRAEWLKRPGDGVYSVFLDGRKVAETGGDFFVFENLETGRDYEFRVECASRRSRPRLARTGVYVGTVVNYLHPDDAYYAFSGRYLCSPCLLRTRAGYLLASMDLFAPSAPQNLTLIYRSDDDGETWSYVTDLMPCFWGRMFELGGVIYMLGCSTEYGDLLIGASYDGGETFDPPVALLRGGGRTDAAGVHKNPQPPVIYGGKIWETLEWGAWKLGGHAAMVMSADINSDLLRPENWAFSAPVPYDPAWTGTAEGPSAGTLEGTLAIAPDNGLVNIMRYEMRSAKPNYGKALVYRVNAENPEAPLIYECAMEFPGNHSKFEVRFDAPSGMYYSIISRITSPETAGARNLLSLMRSADLIKWELVCDLIDYRKSDPAFIGFQYVDFIIEGEDILYLCRTAMNGAHNYHDANCSTFHRLRDFRRETAVRTPRLRAYPMTDAEMEALISLETDPHMINAYGEMLDGARKNPDARIWHTIWRICLDGNAVGDFCFKGITENGETEIGYGIAEEFRGRGYATEIVKAATDWALEMPGITAVTAETEPFNEISRKVLSAAGFVPDGEGAEGMRFIRRKIST